MCKIKQTLLALGVALTALLFSFAAHAECGGQTQCIGVGATPADAAVAHHGGPATYTIAFGNQPIATTSASQTIFVAAVAGGTGTAAIGPFTITDANAAEFSITGGTCALGGPTHGGATCTITVAFNPTTTGAKTATLHVPLNPPCGGCITERVVSLTGAGTGALPTSAATTLSVRGNTPATLDLAPLITGNAPLSVRLVAAPTRGTATLSGTVVTYTPNRDYLGADAFSYDVVGPTGTSPAAVVSISVVARSDPASDRSVTGLIASQAQTVRRFSRAQSVNFQQRMESLRSGTGAGNAAQSGSAGFAGASGANLHPPPAGILQPGVPGSESGVQLASLANTFLGLANTRSLNLAKLGMAASGDAAQQGGTGLWIGGNANFGTRDQTSDSSASRFTSDGVSVGIDHRISNKLALGVGLGYARGHTTIGGDGTKSLARGTSLALYGSYQPTPRTFVDGLLGYGTSRHDMDRFVAAANEFARAQRKADQLFGSMAAGYEHRDGNVLLSPYGRLDFSYDRLKAATESGAGLNALAYHDQKLRSFQFSLGLRADTSHSASFGVIVPRIRIETRHDFKGERQATIAYADQPAGPHYAVTPAMEGRNSLMLGIGSDFILAGGLRLGVDYQVQRSFGPERNQALRLWLAKSLDGKGALPRLDASSRLFSDPVRVEAGYTWDTNLTRARDAGDLRSDGIYGLQASKATIFPVSSNTRLIVSGNLSGDKLHTYSGLDRLAGGLNGEFQYRTSGAFDATTFGAFARASLEQYHAPLRSGYRSSFGVNLRRALTDRIDLFGALASNARHARNVVFDARDYSARFNLDYSLGRSGALYLGGEYRRGDVVSTGRRTAENLSIAKSFVQDDAFGDSQLFAYRVEARTVLWTLGYNLPLGQRDSIDFSWRRAQATPTAHPDPLAAAAYGAAGVLGPSASGRYTAQQYSISYLMRF